MSAHQWENTLTDSPARPFLLQFTTYQAIARAILELQQYALTAIKPATDTTTVTINEGEATIGGTGSSQDIPSGGSDGDLLQRNADGDAYWGPLRFRNQ